MKIFKSLKISSKISLMAMISVFLTAVFFLALVIWQSDVYNKLAQKEVDNLIDFNLKNINQGVYNLVHTENVAVQQEVNKNLSVMHHLVAKSGNITFGKEKIEWQAINQYNKKELNIELPKMMLGKKWIGMNSNFEIPCYLVDLVTQLTGATATIFQRINKQGDMLRVATTVKKSNNQRAIKTYIPAINPDGKANPVVSTILNNKIYQGVAFVVNKHYITAYQPIKDSTGYIIGMIYVGVAKDKVVNRIRKAILNTTVGKTGYVYVISGKGTDKGKYVISKDGERDGENIWEEVDNLGNFVIQDIVAKALLLEENRSYMTEYYWQNLGESVPFLEKSNCYLLCSLGLGYSNYHL